MSVTTVARMGVRSHPADRSPSYQAYPLATPVGLPVGAQVAVSELNDRDVAVVQVTNAASADRSCYLASRRSASWLTVPSSKVVGGKVTALRCHDVAINGTVVGSARIDDSRWVALAWLSGRQPIVLRVKPGPLDIDATAVTTSGRLIYGHRWAFDSCAFLIWDSRGTLLREVSFGFMSEGFRVEDASDTGIAIGASYGGHGTGTPHVIRHGRGQEIQTVGLMDSPDAISPNGRVIVGSASAPDPGGPIGHRDDGVFYRIDGPSQLIPGALPFYPRDTNNASRLVGQVNTSGKHEWSEGEPGVWARGQSYVLNTVTQPALIKITAANAINEPGDIGAVADLGRGPVAVLLVARR